MRLLSFWLPLAFLWASLSALAQVSATIDVNTTATVPVHPGFSGVNDEIGFPIEYWDYRFNTLAAQIGYGWLRFPGGNTGDIYNWQTGEEVPEWFTQFAGYTTGPGPGLVKDVAGKGGGTIIDAANRANLLGASLIICANAFTDTPASIGKLAAYVKANQIPVAAWELANEAYLYPGFFPTGTAYLDQMKPYRDAIKAVDPNAIVAIFVRDPGNSTTVLNSWDQAIAAYPNKYWDAITFHHYPAQSTGNFAQWMADEAAVLANKTNLLVVNQLTPIGPVGVKFLVTEFDPSIPNDANTGAISITDGTLWGGIYATEFIMRMSTVSSMLYVGPHSIVSSSGVLSTDNHYGDVDHAANTGTTIDTLSLDFGFYLAAQANGLAILNGVINHATQSNKTTVTGGATVPATGVGQIPALYAMSYSNAAGGSSVVITNKSATPHQVTIRVNGSAAAGPFPLQFITGADPSAANTAANPAAVTIQTGSSGNPVTVPPYSVLRADLASPPPPAATLVTYYFPHLALGGGWQTTLSYVNYSPQTVTCQTTFLSDSGALLPVSFGGTAASHRTDTLVPGGTLHQQSTANLTAAAVTGWAQAQCSGPVKASLLFRLYTQGVAQEEAGVNAMSAPATQFASFAETQTGVAYANPSTTQPATVTITALNSTGQTLGSKTITLSPGQHGSANVGPLLNLGSFTGSVQITSTAPIVSLALNFEAFPAFSSLPPEELSGSRPTGASAYYFSHLALGGGWQTTITYVNDSSQSVTCQTSFLSDLGVLLAVSFGGTAASSRTDTLLPGGTLHQQSTANLNAPVVTGWAQAQCTGPVKASLLFRLYSQGKAVAEAGVNAMTAPASKFATFAETRTGVAYANPSSQQATITITALDAGGQVLGKANVTLAPGAHGSANVGPLLNLSSFSGSVQITSTAPISSLSLNFEAFPVFSSLPPGELDASTPLSTAP
jgi:hypothetical protein